MVDMFEGEDVEPMQGFNLADYDPVAEEEWEKFEKNCLKWRPTGAELRQRWFRHRFTNFVRKEFNEMNIKPPKPLGSEEVFFTLYPHLKDEWEAEKRKSEALVPTESLMLERWLKQRKFEFKKNWFKRHRADNAFNIKNANLIEADIAAFCNVRPVFNSAVTKTNTFALICILFLVIFILYKNFY